MSAKLESILKWKLSGVVLSKEYLWMVFGSIGFFCVYKNCWGVAGLGWGGGGRCVELVVGVE